LNFRNTARCFEYYYKITVEQIDVHRRGEGNRGGGGGKLPSSNIWDGLLKVQMFNIVVVKTTPKVASYKTRLKITLVITHVHKALTKYIHTNAVKN
jgi:hypothetical protein